MFRPKIPNIKSPFYCTLAAMALLTGCGGSSNGGTDPNDDRRVDDITASVQGTAFASNISGATVGLENALGNPIGGSVLTDSDGVYRLNLDPENEQLRGFFLTSTGGSYTDEATGLIKDAGILRAYIDSDDVNTINLTPSSSVIARMIANGGLSAEQARLRFENAFSYRPDTSITPTDITTEGSANAEPARKLAGLRAAAFSQLADDLGVNQFDLIRALADDLVDGHLDGLNQGSPLLIGQGEQFLPLDIQAMFAHSFVKFYGSGRNKSGLDSNGIGTLPQFHTTQTASYKLKYIAMSPSEEQATEGRNAFTLRITDYDGNPVGGKDVSLHPHMNMIGGHGHTTAVRHIEEDDEQVGDYLGDIYYVMPSVKADGSTMGWWKLSVCISDPDMGAMEMEPMAEDMTGDMNMSSCSGEEAAFYPSVTMKMGVKARLRGGESDQIMNKMTGSTQARTYHLFKHSAHADDTNYHAHVYIAAVENMMHFPGVHNGLVLNEGSESELIINTITVEFRNDGEELWTAATNGHGGGMWAANMNGMPGKMRVRLTINGDVKTINDDDYVEFDMSGEGGLNH
ncbi:MAG: hypothetical protein JKY01_02345 [Pseudomonadales bacterium]|nr:hypothetical protein [Pseudomonadales bacterium]